jgi:large subunit ribosomal protein L10
MLLFQHNNLRATEWMSIRRELALAIRKTDAELSTDLADHVKVQAIQTGIFESALLVAEYYHPSLPQQAGSGIGGDLVPGHYLSRQAHESVKDKKLTHLLRPLLSGPLAVVSFPTVSPQHMRAALSILSPKAPTFPAPTRRANPGYYDIGVQGGLQKLLLLGARVEGRVLDGEGVRWMGGLPGMEGLRAQLVQLLGSVGAGVTSALENPGRSLWFTMEGRRGMLEDEGKEKEDGPKGQGS